ncbi:MAG TPA: chromosome segregation protein SMC [Pirellulales bacterium]|jgi:chromosome segregation protein|nr:chromosome segregation protein SMC [Pirellulales bacterium]
MLKALELVGFKSFADKTHFEFPSGITAVVGPNGSGKSNVVDAIKWVLGEQSVKSLRGKEMVDVIFNGSATRHPLNAAEATLIFDNSQRLLSLDASEVYVTRRVYRSGEAEYLLNRQPCRLRDIRDLFSGTGAATEAYSVIEQGKVDIMLQSSAKDRRLLFEEAAGISRFKAKKLETLRRLERVDQNLLRLKDIVDEVGNRLRSVRLQATKARRYKEYADRLQTLRTQVAHADWRRLGERLAELEGELAELAAGRDGALTEAEQFESQSLAVDAALLEIVAAQQRCEGRSAENRERIASREATLDDERGRIHDAEGEEARLLRQLAAMRVRAGDLQQQLAETAHAADEADERQGAQGDVLSQAEKELTSFTTEFEGIRSEYELTRQAALEATRAVATLETEVASLASQRDAAHAGLERRAARIAELQSAQAEVQAEHERLSHEAEELSQAAEQHTDACLAVENRLAELQSELKASLLDLAQLRQRHTAATERAALLEELEARQEGLGAAAREVLSVIRSEQNGPLRSVRGMLADLLHVSVEMAPAVEAALGDRAQAFVVAPDEAFLRWVQQASLRLPGRVAFVDLTHEEPSAWDDPGDLQGLAGIHGRADHYVDAPRELAGLVRRLLGRTWVVERLSDAITLAAGIGRGANFVTLNGETLAADGALSIGPKQAGAGLISRRSELRALKEQSAALAAKVDDAQAQSDDLERRLAGQSDRQRELAAAQQTATAALNDCRLTLKTSEAARTQLAEQLARLSAEQDQQEAAVRSTDESLAATRLAWEAAKGRLAGFEDASKATRERVRRADERLQQARQSVTAAKVELAKCEERLTSLSTHLAQLRRDQEERRRSVDDCRQQLTRLRQRRRQAEANLLAAESELATCYLLRESLSGDVAELARQHEAKRASRGELQAAAQTSQTRARSLEQQRHARDLAANEVRHERSTLAARLKEDYQVDLAAMDHAPSADEQAQRDEVDQEIAELRRKINHIGTVNLDALAELEELEGRHAKLASQFEDLSKAKDSLVQIIGKINADSRRLFAETLEAVTANFQTLFRKLFGGGQADVVLEEGVDVLESGIEIVARPPGKELRSVSLLSGGEKTLTCVALLLAIFQYRPSPFCVLDEVDAALDEANIERFIGVLQEFLSWTQFIIITHSKKTMTCAGTLYGVTMGESGVSKRVSVRFEDISEDGLISPARIRESA